MRLFHTFLLAGTAILALPPPQPKIPALSPTTIPADTLTLTPPLGANTSLPNIWPIICYHDPRYLPVDQHSCAPLITYLTNRGDYTLPQLWTPGPSQPKWIVQGCKLEITSGNRRSVFSLRDVVVEMLRVLLLCQPPTFGGVGGSAPVAWREEWMHGAFHVQVTGVAG